MLPFCAPSQEVPCPVVLPFPSPPEDDGYHHDDGDDDDHHPHHHCHGNDDDDLLQFPLLGSNGLLQQTDLSLDLYQLRLIPFHYENDDKDDEHEHYDNVDLINDIMKNIKLLKRYE